MSRLSEKEKKINELQEKIDELKRELEDEKTKPEDIRVAEALHELLCHSNHVDQCSWEYESWDNLGSTRKRYLNMADALLEFTDCGTILDIISIIKETRYK